MFCFPGRVSISCMFAWFLVAESDPVVQVRVFALLTVPLPRTGMESSNRPQGKMHSLPDFESSEESIFMTCNKRRLHLEASAGIFDRCRV